MTSIDAVTRAEIEYHHVHARRMAERCRAAWQTAVPTSTRSARLAREVRQWEGRARSWKTIMDLVNYPRKIVSALNLVDPIPTVFEAGSVTINARGLDIDPMVFVDTDGSGTFFCLFPRCPDADSPRNEAAIATHLFLKHKVQIPVGKKGLALPDPVVSACQFCGHAFHGPGTSEQNLCGQVGCGCRDKMGARR